MRIKEGQKLCLGNGYYAAVGALAERADQIRRAFVIGGSLRKSSMQRHIKEKTIICWKQGK